MRGRNRNDVAQYEALHWGLYQAQVALLDVQLALDRQSDCPNGHPFKESLKTDEEGRVVGIKTSVRIEPNGDVVCRLCAAQRGREFRKVRRQRRLEAEGGRYWEGG